MAKILGIKGVTEGDNVEDDTNVGRHQQLNSAMEDPISFEKDTQIAESLLDNKETNFTENTNERQVEDTEEEKVVVPTSKIHEYFTVDETNKNIAKCNRCGKIVRSYQRQINKTKSWKDHLRRHKVEYEQFILFQRSMKLDRKRKFCEDLEDIKRKMSLEYGYEGHKRVHTPVTKQEIKNVLPKPPNTNIHQHFLSNEDAKNKL